MTGSCVNREAHSRVTAAAWMRSRVWQVCAGIGAWAYVVLLHWRNDGLWYLGDSAVHATNGAFWWDFLSRLPHDPLQFALSYYARYPIINPTAYPPLFYVIEGALYRSFGISPYVPRAMVLGCLLAGTLYMVAWIRRWVSKEAAWIGVLFALQPAMVIWGNAIMMNLPSTVMVMAALFHTRCWLEDLRSRHIYAAGAFGVMAILTYVPSVVVLPLMLGVVLIERKPRAVFTRRVMLVASVAAMALIPWVLITLRWASGHRRIAASMGGRPFWELASWLYYPETLPRMVTVPILALVTLGVLFGCINKRQRSELGLAVMWLAICYVWFSFISVKEMRYVLLFVPACLVLAANGTEALLEAVRSTPQRLRWAPGIVLAAIVLVHVPLAYAVKVPRVSGFREIVAYTTGLAPNGWVFYSGDYDGVFGYYLRAHDEHFSRGMIRSAKLLYVTMIEPRFGMHQNVTSAVDVRQALQQHCGCRYLVVERESEDNIPAEQYLREALRSEEFSVVRTFQVETPRVRNVDVYEFLGAGPQTHEFDMAFPLLGNGVSYRVQPIQR